MGHGAEADEPMLVGRSRFSPEPTDSPEGRVLAALGRCVDRWGLAKTTIDDVAAEAGLSRASVYRIFPGGWATLVDSHRRQAIAGFFAELEERVVPAGDLEELLTRSIQVAASLLASDAGFQRDLVEARARVLPALSFRGLDRIFAASRVFLTPHLAPYLPRSEAGRVAEWVARLVLSHLIDPEPGQDLAEEATARRLVRAHLLPGLQPLLASADTTSTSRQE